jgi:hypothetical protein
MPSVPIKSIERAAAAELGYILIEFARLELNLSLAYVWKDRGAELGKLSESIEGAFCERLQLLEVASRERYGNGPGRSAYDSWIADAHRVRKLRIRLCIAAGVSPTTDSLFA